VDETGAIKTGKLILASAAWHQLFGMPPDELIRMTVDELFILEQRLLFSRFTFLFGWHGDVEEDGPGKVKIGRLCIAEVYH
jgi:hypothetical protein